jgi:hypothetical protein
MSSEEFMRWVAYSKVEPFGYHIDNFRAGVVAATVANVAPRGRNARTLKPDDFYPATKSTVVLTPQQEEGLRIRRERRKGKSK